MANSQNQICSARLVTLGVPRLDVATAYATKPHAVGPSKALALITFLAFAPRRTASRDTLCDLLWGDRTMDLARPQLRQTLWLIKTQISSGLLSADTENVSLSGELTSDAVEFASAIEDNDLRRAIDLYSADFFTGYAAPGAGRFEEWASLERTRFRALFVRSAESLGRQALNSGRFAEAIALAHRLRTVDPNGQTGWRLLLESRVASGDSIGAQADADQFDEWLRIEEWDAEPASMAALLGARHAPLPNGSAADSNKLVAELVGREREFAAIHEAWVTAKAKGARITHIVAKSGIGKTRLIRDIIARIRAGRGRARYLRANYGERHIPFSFAAAVAESLATAAGASGVAPAAARTLVSLNPSLSATYSESPGAPEHLEALRVGLALLELVSAIAEEDPIALALDDMHWCDSASREALTVFASNLKSQKVLLITTARTQYEPGPLHEGSMEFRLSRLTHAEVTQLVTSLARLPETSWAEQLPGRLCEAWGGNPLHALEALRFCLDTGLLSRHQDKWVCDDAEELFSALEKKATIHGRIAALSVSERSILLSLAVAGMPTERDIITEAAGLISAEANETAASLELRGLLVAKGSTWNLAHDAIGDAVIGQTDSRALKESHARLGAAMAATDDPRWKKRALVQFAGGDQWAKVAENVIPFLPARATNSRNVDSQIANLLGPAASEATVARVREKLPLKFRRPMLVRQALAAGILAVGGISVFAAARMRSEPKRPNAMLVVLSKGSHDSTAVWDAALDLDHWDAASPLPIDSSRTTAWPSVYAFNLSVPRPGSESWAVYRTYPDSGQGDIDLLSRDGKAVRLTRSRGEDRPQSFSPDGRYLLFLTTRWSTKGWSDVAILDLTNLQVRRLTAGNATYADAHWSPDGSRIVYDREPLTDKEQEICTVDANGANARCRRISNTRVVGAIGWLDERRVLISSGVSRVRTRWAAYDIDRGVVAGTTFSGEDAISLDPSGKWALIRPSTNAQITKVSPAERADLARVIAGDATSPPDVWFASPGPPTSYLDSIAISRPFGSLALGIPNRLVALGWSKARHRMSPVTVRWRSLTPSIANVDSLGVFVARDTGNAVVEVSAGGWRVKRDTLRVRPTALAVFADERWDRHAFERWRPFGDPQPKIVRADTVAAFDNNGDGNFFSGAYLRDGVDPRRGIAMDFDLSTPITQTQWQVVIAGLQSFGDNEQVKKWDHKTGYSPSSQGSSGCFFVYPQGEGVTATTDPVWFPAFRSAMGDSSYRIDTGKWYHVRLQLFPDGRCGIAIDGKPLTISLGSEPSTNSIHAIIEGNSVGTRMLVGHFLIRSGVPTDMDWASLKFTGRVWERSPDDKNLRISQRH